MAGGKEARLIPIYSTSGDWCALLAYPHIFNTSGEWIGWVTEDRQVFDVNGIYVGRLTNGPRILRRRTIEGELPRRLPPPSPNPIRPPATVPLPPMMAELPYQVIDVLESEPDRLHTIDRGDLRQDMG